MASGHQRRFHVEHLAVTLAVLMLALSMALTASPAFLSRFLYDRMLHSLPTPENVNIVVVGIDEFSLRELGRWPWDRSVHAELIRQLDRQGARAILLDLLLSEPDQLRPQSDRALAQAIRDHGAVYLPVHVDQLRTGGQLIEVLPYGLFAEAAKGLGHVDLEVDSDGVVRRVFMRSGIGQAWWPHISLAMMQDLSLHRVAEYQQFDPPRRGSFANVRQYPRMIPFIDQSGAFPQLSAVDVIRGRVPEQLLEDQIVMVGATASGLGDMLSTPMSAEGLLMPGVELNANIFQALMHDQLIRPLGQPSTVLLSIVLAIIAPLLLPFVTPRWSLPLMAAILALQVLLGYALLRLGHYWLPLGPALVATVLAYPLWTWRRLEYTLDYLRAALSRLAEYGELNRRLSEPAPLLPLLRMVEQVLPVTAWRLENRSRQRVQLGGREVDETAWQSRRARHYGFQRGTDEFELSLLWQDEELDLRLHAWVQAMVTRASAAPPPGGAAYEVVENYIERVSEEELRQQALTRFFNASLAQLQDGVAICDACGDVLFANRRALNWLDLASEQLPTLHFLDIARELVLPRDQADWAHLVAEALMEGSVQLECHTHRGDELYLDLARLDAGERPGRVLVLTLKDISDVKQAMRTRSEMLDFLSHDLRSPMISLLALSEKMRQGESGDELREFLDSIDHHARRNLNIAEQFLQLAKVESLETLEMIELDMLPVVESAIDDVQAQAQARDIKLRFDYDEQDEVWVQGNHELLQRLLVNLLTNAIKYSHTGSLVDIHLFSSGDQVACEVRDRGVGIPPAYLDRVFERFTRVQGSTGTRGAGLGLRFVKVVADRHGGQIQVDSRPGEGSRFTLLLPRLRLDSL